ncbi:SDR family NAD(P)-dependent oxidoreductase [Rhodopila sp.]|uniref:SDR family NAD(P)-dependent oxidoreductase n=1 Tax=Rhodopila sp. TaxID=2480087 RepID=UPI003D0BE002
MLLKDKVIVVTGADSGIGRATSRILAHVGARLIVTGRDAPRIEQAATEIRGAGGVATALQADVTKEADVIAMVDRALSEHGRLDGAFNNAGVNMRNKPTADLEAAEWDAVLDVNLKGVFLCMKYEIKAMQTSGGGAIVNNASNIGAVGMPFATEYAASKHGVIGATRAASCEAAKTGVRVNAVLPGMVMTPMIDDLVKNPDFKDFYDAALARHSIGRFGQPEEIGHAVKWLLSDEASFVNGAAFAVDGGYTAR